MDLAAGRLAAAVRKEFRQFLRDPVLLFLVLWLYTIEVAICAFSLTFDLREEPIAVLDLDRTDASVELVDRFERSSSFDVAFSPSRDDQARALIDRGETRLVVVIPRGFEEELQRRLDSSVQYLVDGTNSMMAMTTLGAARALAADASLELADGRLGALPRAPWIENRPRVLYNPEIRFVYFVAISMIALGAFMVGMVLPAASIVKEKERGTIEQLLVTPLTPAEIIAAKVLPTFAIGLVSLGPAVLVTRAFGVPVRGDPFTFGLLSAAFLLSAMGSGVLIATFVRTLQQALLVSFMVIMPLMAISGTMTPVESMPPALQSLSRMSALRYYVESLLGVFLKGVGLEVLWPQLAWMLGLGTALFAVSVYQFRRRLV